MDHTPGDECPCNPTTVPVTDDYDSLLGWVYAHNEEGQTPEQDADRALRIFEAMEQVRNDT